MQFTQDLVLEFFNGAEEVNVSGIYRPFTRKCNENKKMYQVQINMLPLLGF